MTKQRLFSLFFLITLSLIQGCSQTVQKVPLETEPTQRPPIWGEGAEVKEEYIDVTRVSPTEPSALAAIYYSANPPEGTVVDLPTFAQGRLGFHVLDPNGKNIDVIQSNGNYYVKGLKGQRYTLYIENLSNRGYEILMTADGLSSTTAKEGRYDDAGYILFPAKHITIKGFRETRQEYKPFIFHEKDSPYIKDSNTGSSANIGVIGFAAFELQTPRVPIQIKPNAFPGETHLFRLDK